MQQHLIQRKIIKKHGTESRLLSKVYRQTQQVGSKLDGYHQAVKDGFTSDLKKIIGELRHDQLAVHTRHASDIQSLQNKVMQLEKARTKLQVQSNCADQEKRTVALLHTELIDENRRLSTTVERLHLQNIQLPHLDARVRVLQREQCDAQARETQNTTDLVRLRSTVVRIERDNAALQGRATYTAERERVYVATQATNVQMMLERQLLLTERDRLEGQASRIPALEALAAENQGLRIDRVECERYRKEVPALEEKGRWFDHFLPNIDPSVLTNPVTVGHAQEIATYTLLTDLFKNQFYSIEVVSKEAHHADICIRPEADGPAVLVEVKSFVPSSKGIRTKDGPSVHPVRSTVGRLKLIDDLDQQRFEGCLTGVMIVHPLQTIPTVDMRDDVVVVDTQHPHIFYSYLCVEQVRRTILAAVRHAYVLQGRTQATHEYRGHIQTLSALLQGSNAEIVDMVVGIQTHMGVFGKHHQRHTSTAASMGINLRSITGATRDHKHALRIGTKRKRPVTATA